MRNRDIPTIARLRIQRRFEAFVSANPVNVPITSEMEVTKRIAESRFQDEVSLQG